MSVSARAGELFPSNGVGTPILGVDADGRLAPLRGGADSVATNETVTGAGGGAAAITLDAETDISHVIRDVHYSYSAAPTGGGLTIKDGATDVIFDIHITAAGPGSVLFGSGKQGTSGRSMVVTLAAPGGAVVGKLNISSVKASVLQGGALNFGDEMNSGLIAMF